GWRGRDRWLRPDVGAPPPALPGRGGSVHPAPDRALSSLPRPIAPTATPDRSRRGGWWAGWRARVRLARVWPVPALKWLVFPLPRSRRVGRGSAAFDSSPS